MNHSDINMIKEFIEVTDGKRVP